MKQVAVITEGESDLLVAMKQLPVSVTVFKPGELDRHGLEQFDCIALLGGVSRQPMLLHPRERMFIEEQIRVGKKVLAEYCASIGHVYFEPPVQTRFERLVFCGKDEAFPGLTAGDLIDDQYGMRLRPHAISCVHDVPILQYVRVNAHDHIDFSHELVSDVSDRALWFDRPKHLLVCSFRLCNFVRARFAPKGRVYRLVQLVLQWLTGEKWKPSLAESYVLGSTTTETDDFAHQMHQTVERAMNWFFNANILQNDGKDGVYEGLGTEIDSEGRQRVNQTLRADCIGETSMAFLLHSMLTGDERSLQVSNDLAAFVFRYMQNKERNEFFGMLRWTAEAWGICYQDDVARAIIPELLKCLYLGTDKHLESCIHALQFLVNTTGTDGTRVFRTDQVALDRTAMQQLTLKPGGLPSAHYNAYYHASLLLCYQLTGIESFKNTAVTGLETIMKVYPRTVREHSQTQELCRLVLPLSWLYWVTKENTHRRWLYRVCEDLDRFKHRAGVYVEWDDGYQASMRNPIGEGESSLLTVNGDPVVDLLYSNNWLPVGFIQAYFVTGDPYFKQLWQESAMFMARVQIYSRNKQIDGAWARAIDVERMEVYGSPADSGWGPWAIESGWTIAEIASGLMMGLMSDQLRPFYLPENSRV